MTFRLASRLPPPTSAPTQSPAVASARRNATSRTRERTGNNASGNLVTNSAGSARQRDVTAGKSGSAKHPPESVSGFPAVEYLLQALESAVHGGVFQGGATEHRLLELVSAAKRELRGTAQHIAQLEAQNDELESECRRYKISVSKIQTQSETLRRSSRGKDALCDAQLQKLVVLLREVHGYEDEPALSEDEQQQEQLALSDISDDAGSDNENSRSRSSSSSSSSSADSQLGGSNQNEEEPVSDESLSESAPSDDEVAPLSSSVMPLEDCSDATQAASLSSSAPLFLLSTAPASRGKLPHSLLPLTVAEPMKKTVNEPKPPRGSSISSSGGSAVVTKPSAPRGSRLKFQFPETELGSGDGFYDDVDDLEEKREAAGSTLADASQSPSRLAYLQRRRFSSSAAISTAVPLRRKSFTMKRSPAKRIAVTTSESEHSVAQLPPSSSVTAASAPGSSGSATPTRWATRRKSTSACYPVRRGSSSNSNRSPAKWKTELKHGSTAAHELSAGSGRRGSVSLAASASSSSSSSSQMVVRVRERKLDGIPELVIRKKPARFIVWQWNERQVRIPFMIQLGPTQHGIMLRQLRYVKSVMHDFPWAKAHLKDLLSAYTKQDMTKEQLYPQLNYLSHHVQEELGGRAKKQRQLAQKKHHLTLQLTLAAGTVNDLSMIKFGRRGKPHETKLRYDPSDPTRLHWLRKNGDRSDEFLCVDAIDVRAQFDTTVLKRAARKHVLDPNACVSLVTASRSLDLQLKSSMQRDWLLNALRDIISFAKQYKAAGAVNRRHQSLRDPRTLSVVTRR